MYSFDENYPTFRCKNMSVKSLLVLVQLLCFSIRIIKRKTCVGCLVPFALGVNDAIHSPCFKGCAQHPLPTEGSLWAHAHGADLPAATLGPHQFSPLVEPSEGSFLTQLFSFLALI